MWRGIFLQRHCNASANAQSNANANVNANTNDNANANANANATCYVTATPMYWVAFLVSAIGSFAILIAMSCVRSLRV